MTSSRIQKNCIRRSGSAFAYLSLTLMLLFPTIPSFGSWKTSSIPDSMTFSINPAPVSWNIILPQHVGLGSEALTYPSELLLLHCPQVRIITKISSEGSILNVELILETGFPDHIQGELALIEVLSQNGEVISRFRIEMQIGGFPIIQIQT